MANKAQHTPRPWKFDAHSGAVFYADENVEPVIASVNIDDVSDEQADADGRLIAAAPDLLAALVLMEALPVNKSWAENEVKARDAARAAIAKATEA